MAFDMMNNKYTFACICMPLKTKENDGVEGTSRVGWQPDGASPN